MTTRSDGGSGRPRAGSGKLDRLVADARRARDEREQGYRARALELYPWICTRCGREFDRGNLRELTVHHRDHDHDNNPPDGSNWELLCIYCHENEHARHEDYLAGGGAEVGGPGAEPATFSPFADLKARLADKKE